MERIFIFFAILTLCQACNLQSGKAVSLKLKDQNDQWLSCYVANSDCQFRDCPGKQAHPFVPGGEHGFLCRGEIFWIHKQGGGDINSCDVVALEYKTGWWFSCSDHDVGERCKTRTCPGDSWGGNWDRCTYEKFRIAAIGKKCGDQIIFGDIIVLHTNESDKVVSKRRTCNSLGQCLSVGGDVRTGQLDSTNHPLCLAIHNGAVCHTFSTEYNHQFQLFIQQ